MYKLGRIYFYSRILNHLERILRLILKINDTYILGLEKQQNFSTERHLSISIFINIS